MSDQAAAWYSITQAPPPADVAPFMGPIDQAPFMGPIDQPNYRPPVASPLAFLSSPAGAPSTWPFLIMAGLAVAVLVLVLRK
jgi:hypothetical protein